MPCNGQPIKDKEFTLQLRSELHWVLISSFVRPDGEANSKIYLFIRNISKFKMEIPQWLITQLRAFLIGY